MTRERELLEEIRDDLRHIVRLLRRLLTPTTVPTSIVFTDTQGVPVTTVSLTGTETANIPVLVGDVNGVPIPGDVLDAGAAVSVGDPTICSAVLSADRTSVAVTALDKTGTTTLTATGTFGAATLTPGNLTVDTTGAATGATPAEIVFGTPVVEGSTIPTTGTAVLDPATNLPLYTWDGTTAAATGTFVLVNDVQGPSAAPLYTFSGDVAGQAPTGVQAGYALFADAPVAVPGSTTGHAPA